MRSGTARSEARQRRRLPDRRHAQLSRRHTVGAGQSIHTPAHSRNGSQQQAGRATVEQRVLADAHPIQHGYATAADALYLRQRSVLQRALVHSEREPARAVLSLSDVRAVACYCTLIVTPGWLAASPETISIGTNPTGAFAGTRMLICPTPGCRADQHPGDRKSTRLNST